MSRAPSPSAKVTISDEVTIATACAQRWLFGSSLSSLIVTGAAPWAIREKDESDESDVHPPSVVRMRARASNTKPALFVTFVTCH